MRNAAGAAGMRIDPRAVELQPLYRDHSGLGRDPLAEKEAKRAVVITTEHTEGKGPGSGEYVEERLLLDRVELEGAHVPPRHFENAAFVEADAAYTGPPFLDLAVVTAGVAMEGAVRQLVVELSRPGKLLEHLL